MSQKLLLPNHYKKIGWGILIPAAIAGLLLAFTDFDGLPFKAKVFALFTGEMFGKNQTSFTFIHTNVTNTIVGVLFIVGALLVSFSKEKDEDEFISNLRLSSLLWAVLVSYLLLLFSFVFIYGTAFLYVMLYNMFTVLIIFIVRFNYVLYRNSKSVLDEK
ncbi:MAG: hypothetical protein JST47_16395 [Bacteroidetes bacterium]|nr:hypothetical protein [Bacteroidota bacterium]MBS1975496.1 hypothetical protein [Bacteroidota bacterium]